MTDKIVFRTNGEEGTLPIDGSKTLRAGNASPQTKLTVEQYSVTGIRTPTPSIVFNNTGSEPIMTIRPDGTIELSDHAKPTEAAQLCINAMQSLLQGMLDAAARKERDAIVRWLREEKIDWCRCEDYIEAGEHRKERS